MSVHVTRSLSQNSAFGRQISQASSRKVAAQMETMRRSAEAEFDEIVGGAYANDRDPSRRRHGQHLLGSSSCEVIWDGSDFPVSLSISSSAPSAKVNSLNFGSAPHGIDGNPWLVFPAVAKGASNLSAARGRNRSAKTRAGNSVGRGTGRRTVRTTHVDHPGTEPKYFMESALERVVERFYGQAVRLARKR